MDDHSRVRIAFALLVVFAFSGFVLALAGLEPYPSAVFPAFEQSGSPTGEIMFEEPFALVWTDGVHQEVQASDLLKGVPKSYRAALLQNRFRYVNGSGLPDKVIEAKLGGHSYLIRRVMRTHFESEIRTWKESVLQHFEGNRPDSITLTWLQYRSFGDGWTTTELGQELVLDFTELSNSEP